MDGSISIDTQTLDALTHRFTRARFDSFRALCDAAPGYTPTFRVDETGQRDGLILAHHYNASCVFPALVWDYDGARGKWITLRAPAVTSALALHQQAAA